MPMLIALLTDVDKVHDSVADAIDEDEPACHFVEVDVLVEWQDDVHAELAQLGDGVAQHQHQDEHTREVEALAWAMMTDDMML